MKEAKVSAAEAQVKEKDEGKRQIKENRKLQRKEKPEKQTKRRKILRDSNS